MQRAPFHRATRPLRRVDTLVPFFDPLFSVLRCRFRPAHPHPARSRNPSPSALSHRSLNVQLRRDVSRAKKAVVGSDGLTLLTTVGAGTKGGWVSRGRRASGGGSSVPWTRDGGKGKETRSGTPVFVAARVPRGEDGARSEKGAVERQDRWRKQRQRTMKEGGSSGRAKAHGEKVLCQEESDGCLT